MHLCDGQAAARIGVLATLLDCGTPVIDRATDELNAAVAAVTAFERLGRHVEGRLAPTADIHRSDLTALKQTVTTASSSRL